MKRYAILIFIVLVLLIVFPWLQHGYVLSLDSIFTPSLTLPASFSIDFFYRYILFSLNQIIPSWIIEKIILFIIPFLFFWGFFNLNKNAEFLPKLFCGIFGVFNAFFYYRFVTGEIRLLLAFSVIPFIIILLNDFYQSLIKIKKQNINQIIIKIFILCLIAFLIYPRVLSLIGIIFISALVIFIFSSLTNRKSKKIFLIILVTSIAASFFTINNKNIALINQYFPSLININQTHFNVFATKISIWNIFNLTGSWIEATNRYLNPAKVNILWISLGLIFICLFFIGLMWYFKDRNHKDAIGKILFFSLIITLIILFISKYNIYYKFCNYNILFFALRDPAKLYIIILLAEAFFISFAINKILNLYPKFKVMTILAVLFLIIPIARFPIIPFGLVGQLKSVDYPSSWYQLNNKLSSQKDKFNVLFLPWHQYMRFTFTPTVIQNPASYFFSKPIIAGDNLEIGSIYSQSINTETQRISQSIIHKEKLSSVAKKFNIKYIILAKTVNWEQYTFLEQDDHLKLIEENSDYKLYLNLVF